MNRPTTPKPTRSADHAGHDQQHRELHAALDQPRRSTLSSMITGRLKTTNPIAAPVLPVQYSQSTAAASTGSGPICVTLKTPYLSLRNAATQLDQAAPEGRVWPGAVHDAALVAIPR